MCGGIELTTATGKWSKDHVEVAVHIVKQPPELDSGEVSRQREAALVTEVVGGLEDVLERGDCLAGAAVEPDHGVVQRLASPTVPDHRGLALVGYADASNVLNGQVAAA